MSTGARHAFPGAQPQKHRPTRVYRAIGLTYGIGLDGDWIECFRCGMVGYNPHDIAQRYCGKCHRFHEEGEEERCLSTCSRRKAL